MQTPSDIAADLFQYLSEKQAAGMLTLKTTSLTKNTDTGNWERRVELHTTRVVLENIVVPGLRSVRPSCNPRFWDVGPILNVPEAHNFVLVVELA